MDFELSDEQRLIQETVRDFVDEKGMPGFSAAETEHKLGVWAGSTGELFFQNVEVPAENLIGEEGQGFEIAMYGLDQGRFTVGAGACGVIRACLERSVEYARERETFGQPIGKYQFVQDMIASMVLGYETSKLLVMQAAWMKDAGEPFPMRSGVVFLVEPERARETILPFRHEP